MQVGATRQFEAKELQEILRISAVHPDPQAYMLEQVRFQHDAITRKVNSKNKF